MTVQIHKIQKGNLSVHFCPEIGGSITRYDVTKEDGLAVPLFRPFDESLPLDPLNFGSFPLTPFSNRIGHGKLSFEGKTYNVGPAFGGEPHPNHGSGWQSAWTLEEKGDDFARLSIRVPKSDESPYDYEATQLFQLTESGLSITMTIKNTGEETLPFGTGHHPYFVRTSQTILKANLPKVWLSEGMIPNELVNVPDIWKFVDGKIFDPNKLEARHGGDGSAYIDHCFAEWDRVAKITWPEAKTSLIITADPMFGHFVVFVPSKGDFFCAEPVSNSTDGFNLMAKRVNNTGTIVLKPQQSLKGTMHYNLA